MEDLKEVKQSDKTFDPDYRPPYPTDHVVGLKRCPHINNKGQRRGEECSRSVPYGRDFCATHTKMNEELEQIKKEKEESKNQNILKSLKNLVPENNIEDIQEDEDIEDEDEDDYERLINKLNERKPIKSKIHESHEPLYIAFLKLVLELKKLEDTN
jgi:hypothetical protein